MARIIILHGQWKLFYSQWKVRDLFCFQWMATLCMMERVSTPAKREGMVPYFLLWRDAKQNKLKTGSLKFYWFSWGIEFIHPEKKKNSMLKESSLTVKRPAIGSICACTPVILVCHLSTSFSIKLKLFNQELFLPKQSTLMLTSENSRVNPIHEKSCHLQVSQSRMN